MKCLSSLDRKQTEIASDHVQKKCALGPMAALILCDAGVCPALVDLLRLEGLKVREYEEEGVVFGRRLSFPRPI